MTWEEISLPEDALVCDTNNCRITASKWLQITCCNTVFILCDGCSDKMVEINHLMTADYRQVTCRKCDETNYIENLFTPIRDI